MLDALIDQRLAQQGAVERRLDRAPEVLQALEAAKAQVLARAYLEELARTQPDPSAEDVRQYYVAHPELFAERHVFMLEQIDLPRASDIAAALRERAASPGASIEAIADWLRARDVPHSVTRGVRAGDHVPLQLLPKLRSMWTISQVTSTFKVNPPCATSRACMPTIAATNKNRPCARAPKRSGEL